MDTNPRPTPAQSFNQAICQARMKMTFYLSELKKLKANGPTPENDYHYRDVSVNFRNARSLYLSLFSSRYLSNEQRVLIDRASQATSSLNDLRGGELFAGLT